MRFAAPEHLCAFASCQDFRQRFQTSCFTHGGRICERKFSSNFCLLAVARGQSSLLTMRGIEFPEGCLLRLAEIYPEPQKFAGVLVNLRELQVPPFLDRYSITFRTRSGSIESAFCQVRSGGLRLSHLFGEGTFSLSNRSQISKRASASFQRLPYDVTIAATFLCSSTFTLGPRRWELGSGARGWAAATLWSPWGVRFQLQI